MSQSSIRAVIRGESVPKLTAILEHTGLSTPSEVISVLISRYGQALIDGWQVSGVSQPTQAYSTPTVQPLDYSKGISL